MKSKKADEYIGNAALEQRIVAKKSKTRWDLAEWPFFRAICEVLTTGANKYSPDQWKTMTGGREHFFSALMRHIDQWKEGQKIDEETGKSHLVHAACNLMFLDWLDRRQEDGQ